MKKLLGTIIILFTVFIGFSFGQDGNEVGPVFDLTPLAVYFGTTGTVAGLIIGITQAIKKKFVLNGTWAWITSAVIGSALGAVGFLWQLGMYKGVHWALAAIYTIIAIFIANGFYTNKIKEWLEKIGLKTPQIY